MATAPTLTFRPYDVSQNGEVPAELLNFLRTEAEGARDSTLDEAREAALLAYQGAAYGDEEEGRSQAVTRDVSETIDIMLTGIIGAVMAGGKAVEFETEPEEIDAPGPNGQPIKRKVDYGAQATAAIQYHFFRKQGGYRILHDVAKAGMMEKTGVVKTYAEQKAPAQQTATVPAGVLNWTEAEPTLDGMRVLSAEPMPDPAIDEQEAMADVGMPVTPAERMWTVTVEVPQPPAVRDVYVPNEWFLVSPDTIELDTSPYVGDCTPTTISALVAMGYDWERVRDLWDNAAPDTVVSNARDIDRGRTRQTANVRTGPERQLWLHEEYPLYDLNGDGVAERLFVHRIGSEVLNILEVDEQPYSGWSPIPMQGRFVGQSMADKTQDIQRIRTALLRTGLDSLYQSVAPRMTVSMDAVTEDTFDDLLTIRPGGLIRYRGGVPPTPLQTSDKSGLAWQGMEMMSAERESRTGVTRQSQGMNPDTTNKTAFGMAQLQQNADQIELYVTRNFLEGLVAPMFSKRYRLMRKHMKPFRMKLDGEYVEINPALWPEEPDVQINVGLGTGSKEEKMGYRRELAAVLGNMQDDGSRLVDDQKIYNLLGSIIDDAGIGVKTDFINDPSMLPPAPPAADKPDPAVLKVQGDQQLAQAELQARQQHDMAGIELSVRKDQMEAQLRAQASDYDLQARREAAALDSELKRDKAAEEARLAQQRADREWELSLLRFEREMQLAERKASMAPANDDAGLPALRPGGDLSE